VVIRNARERQTLGEFATEWPFCMACGIAAGTDERQRMDHPRNLEIHHLTKIQRRHEKWNLMKLCKLCHDAHHGGGITVLNSRRKRIEIPGLTLANLLWIKRLLDPGNYDRQKMAMFMVRNVPVVRRPPSWYLEAWNRHRHCTHQRFLAIRAMAEKRQAGLYRRDGD